jgi:hypothetical protein
MLKFDANVSAVTYVQAAFRPLHADTQLGCYDGQHRVCLVVLLQSI